MTVFSEELQLEAFPFHFAGQLHVETILGGVPSDDRVAEGWIKTKLGITNERMLQEAVAKTMVERGITDVNEATEIVNKVKNLNGFKRDENGLYIEGRQLKAAIKEATSVAMAADKLPARGWGKTNKGILSYVAEHIFVVETKLYLGVHEATGINQRFVSTFRGTGIHYEEYVDDVKINFTVVTDHDFTDHDWAMIWLTGQMQGIGASRSQGYGRYEVTKWEKVDSGEFVRLRTQKEPAQAMRQR